MHIVNSIYLHPNCSKWDSTNEFYLRSYIATDWTKNGSNINISWVWLIWIYSFCFCPHIWNRESDLRIAVCMWNVGLWKYQTLWCSSWRLYCWCSHWSESVYSPNLYWGQAGARTDGTSVQFLSEQVYWCIEHLYTVQPYNCDKQSVSAKSLNFAHIKKEDLFLWFFLLRAKMSELGHILFPQPSFEARELGQDASGGGGYNYVL